MPFPIFFAVGLSLRIRMLPAIDQTGLDGIALEFARQTDTIAAAFELVRSLDAPAELALSSPSGLRCSFLCLVAT